MPQNHLNEVIVEGCWRLQFSFFWIFFVGHLSCADLPGAAWWETWRSSGGKNIPGVLRPGKDGTRVQPRRAWIVEINQGFTMFVTILLLNFWRSLDCLGCAKASHFRSCQSKHFLLLLALCSKAAWHPVRKDWLANATKIIACTYCIEPRPKSRNCTNLAFQNHIILTDQLQITQWIFSQSLTQP